MQCNHECSFLPRTVLFDAVQVVTPSTLSFEPVFRMDMSAVGGLGGAAVIQTDSLHIVQCTDLVVRPSTCAGCGL